MKNYIKIFVLNLGLCFLVFSPLFGVDSRDQKFGLSLIFALLIFIWGMGQQLKPLKNRWILFFLAAMFYSGWLAPKEIIETGHKTIVQFWIWKTIGISFIFFMAYRVIAGAEITQDMRKWIVKTMVWCGFLLSIHCIGQHFGLLQWFTVNNHILEIRNLNQSQVVGMLNHPTLVGPFIAMLVPLAIYLRKWLFIPFMITAVLLTQSWVAGIAMGVSLSSLFFIMSKKRLILGVCAIILLIGIGITGYTTNPKIKAFVNSESSGRAGEWKQVIHDLHKPYHKNYYVYTGMGPGSFKYMYPRRVKSTFVQAHNEYLEIFYTLGYVGLVLFLISLSVFFVNIDYESRINRYLFGSCLCAMIAAGGIFMFQLSPHNIFIITIAGLLSNKGE